MTADIVPFGLPRPMAEELIHKLAKMDAYVAEPAFREKLHGRDFTMR
jgi:hypothetical protein